MDGLIAQLDLYFGQKAPRLPDGVKEFIVKISPWLIIIGLIFVVIAVLQVLALTTGFGLFSLAAIGSGSMMKMVISLVIGIIGGIIQLIALPGLFKRTPESWKLLFYAECVSLVGSLISLNIVGFIINALIGFYILFQCRPLFGGMNSVGSMGNMNPPTPPTSPTPMA
jgi:hypothetical protein